eukprot:scaffold111151_cov66-Cyclotella_meneghiniana.AAC.2
MAAVQKKRRDRCCYFHPNTRIDYTNSKEPIDQNRRTILCREKSTSNILSSSSLLQAATMDVTRSSSLHKSTKRSEAISAACRDRIACDWLGVIIIVHKSSSQSQRVSL